MSSTVSAASDVVGSSYNRLQRGLHWLMAAIILTAIGLGVWSTFFVAGAPFRRTLLDLHKSLGMTALILVVIRIACRLVFGEPPYRRPLGALVHLGARIAHRALYLMMLYMPLSGYWLSASGGYSTPWFGLFSWPRLVPLDKAASSFGDALHYWGAWAIGTLLVAHGLAVIWHTFIKKDEVLWRMLPAKQM